MNKAVLLLGTNTGEKLLNLEKARAMLSAEAGEIIQRSSIYETAAWGNENQDSFLNEAVIIETKLSANELMNKIISIEEKLGRIRSIKWEPRIIDIDILFFNDEIIENVGAQNFVPLIVPHPFLHKRMFTLAPLNEMIPDYIHPVFKKSIRQLLSETEDTLEVKKISITPIQ